MNKNLPVESISSPSNSSAEFSNSRQGQSTSIGSKGSQQPTVSRRARAGNRGKGGTSNRPEAANRLARRVPQSSKVEGEEGSCHADANNSGHGSNDASTGRARGSNRGFRGSSGKYRQRQQTRQYMDGMKGLDIDLLESIAPTNSSQVNIEASKNQYITNNRKMNFTHLINDRKQRSGRYPYGDYSGHYYRNPHSYYRDFGNAHKFDKQQFLQANCQFVVLDGHDYTVHKIDPDWPVDWDCVEEVKFRQIASTETTCPICLDPPIAAKITRCGHIYCWTCMLHYLSLSDAVCRQCPICFEPVSRDDLRSVQAQSLPEHSVKEEIVMKLMIRKKGCVEVEPYRCESMQLQSDNSSSESKLNQDQDVEHYSSQANLLIVDPLTVISKVTQRERTELMFKIELDREEPEVCFIEQALDLLEKREQQLSQMTRRSSEENSQESDHMVTPSGQTSPPTESEPSKSYLFYQSSDGQHIYLNPFSTRILNHEFCSMESCPLEIRAKILQMDWVSMNEAWRKRFKYLEHLPLTCEFRLIEIDFDKSELVSRSTYLAFEEEIQARSRERKRRLREERKRDKIIQVEQNRRIYGIQPALEINLNNTDQFPSVSDERYLGLTKPKIQKNGSDEDSSLSESENVQNVEVDTGTRPSPGVAPHGSEQDNVSVGNDVVALTNVALSFREIQIQEEAKSRREEKEHKASEGSRPWASKAQNPANTSSFAQLLVDAKKSQKEWTRNVKPVVPPAPFEPNGPSGFNSHRQKHDSSSMGSDDGAEQLQGPPPGEFTISDFIDTNVASSSGKGRKGRPKKA